MTYTLDLPGGKITDDSFPGMGDDLLVALHLVLQTMLGMLDPMALQAIAELIGSGQAIANCLDLAHHIACRISNNLAGTIDGNHILDSGSVCSFRVEELIKLTQHFFSPFLCSQKQSSLTDTTLVKLPCS